MLPVEAGTTTKWGDGLLEVKGTNFHNKYKLVCCEPTFSHLPWYCDHPTDLGIRQESYLLKAIIPFVESEYSVSRKAADRLLVGFSKSGWGAISLLLRNPDVFGKAAAWDAPLMQRQPNQYGMGPIFGDNKNFDGYELSRLIQERGTAFRDEPRLAILGYGNFREHHTAFRTILNNAQVMHEYRDGPQRKHAWGSGWLPAAIEFLAKPASASK